MLHPSQAHWNQWNIHSDHHRFFFLRWKELFDLNTFDTWQVRSSGVRSMLAELEESARIVAISKSHHPNIDSILSEMDVVTQHDRVIKEHLPAVREHIAKLRNLYDHDIKPTDSPNVEPFLRVVRIARSQLSGYTQHLFDAVISVLDVEQPQKYKQDLHMLAMLLGIELKNLGYSIEGLRESARVLENNPEVSFPNRFRRIRQSFSVQSVSHICRVLVRGPGNFGGIDNSGAVVVDRNPDEEHEAESKFWRQDAGAPVSALEFSVIAKDAFSARRQAVQRVEGFLSFWKIYRPSKENRVHPGVLVRSERQDMQLLEPDTEPEVLLPRDARGSDQRAADLIATVASIQKEHATHVEAALQYFQLSLYARKQEARLINLWIGLEALVQAIGQGSLISKITNYISDIMALHYVQDIARAIPVDARRIWRVSQPVSFLDRLPQSNGEILHSDDFMWLMTIPDTSQTWSAFAGLFKTNPLMIFRLWKLRNGLFKRPSEMADRISQHKTNVSWQIQRIYRLRNQIAHEGTAIGDISQLIGHLQTYFVTAFHDIVHTLKQRQLESVGDVLESRSLDYQYIRNRLTEDSARPIPVRLVSTGFAENDGSGSRCLWQE